VTDFNVGLGQDYATPQAAWNAMEGDGVPFADHNRMVLHAGTYTSILDMTTKHPVMTSANRLTITVYGTDAVTWNNGVDSRCIESDDGSNEYVTIDVGSGTLTIDGCTAGSETVLFEWSKNLTITNCTINAPNTAGSNAIDFLFSWAEAYNADIQWTGLQSTAPQGDCFYVRADDADYGLGGLIEGCTFHDSSGYGLQLRTISKTLAVQNCLFDALGTPIRCLNYNNGTGTLTVDRNRFTGNVSGDAVVYGFLPADAGTLNLTLTQNRLYDCGTHGLLGDEGDSGNNQFTVLNNTLDGEGTSTNFLNVNGNASSAFACKNNIFYDCGGTAVNKASGGTGYLGTDDIDYNCWNSNVGDTGGWFRKGANQIGTAPGFEGGATDDYTLDGASACIDAGTDLGYGDDMGYRQAAYKQQQTLNAGMW